MNKSIPTQPIPLERRTTLASTNLILNLPNKSHSVKDKNWNQQSIIPIGIFYKSNHE